MSDLFGLTVTAWGLFALTSVLIELTPGPNMVWLAVVGATQGRRPGYAAVTGVALGLAVVGGAAALGLASVINASPAAYQVLRWGGVFYLLWLAWDGWRDADGGAEEVPEVQALRRYFGRGLTTNLLNPKAAVFYIAVLPGFLNPLGGVLGQTLILSMTYVAIATVIHASIVTAASAMRPLLEDRRRSRTIRRALALALALIAIWFAWKTRL